MTLRPETVRALIAADIDLEERDASSGLVFKKPTHLGSKHDRKVYIGRKHVGWVSQDIDGWHGTLVGHAGQRIQQKYVSGPHRQRSTAERHVKEAAAKASGRRMTWEQRMAWQKEAEGHDPVEEGTMTCECGAPARGSVCQRGHRLQEARGGWGDVKEGDYVTSKGRHGVGQPEVTGKLEKLEGQHAHVRTADGKLRRRTISKLRRLEEAKVAGEKPTKYDFMSKDELAEAIKKLKADPNASGVEVAHANQAWARRFAQEARIEEVKVGDVRLGDEAELRESKQTAALSVTHAPIGKGGTNWVTRSKPGNTGQLPAYIQNIRNAIIRDGKDESTATALAVGAVKRWASGRGGVSAEVKAAAAKAVAEWEATRAAGKAGDKASKAAKKAA